MRLSDLDRKRIDAAITAAESRTTGEIFCVLTQEVSNYREVPLGWAAIAALALPALAVLLGLHELALANIFTSWTDDSVRAVEGLILRALASYSLLQAGIFVSVVLIVSLPSVRRVMTPGALKTHRVRRAAMHHFVAHSHKLSDAAPHVLIFAAMKDRRVELVAHDAIHRAVGAEPWNAAVTAVAAAMKTAMQTGANPTDGYVRAIEICGAALAAHFSADGPNENLLSNEIIET